MTHASVAGTDLEVPADLIRLSVGIETVEDLIADLDRALGVNRATSDVSSRGTSDGSAAPRRRAGGVRGLRVDVHQGGAGRPARRAARRDGGAPDDDRHRRARRLAGVPRPARRRSNQRAADAEVLACSSAGGGLRIGVVGNERLVTAEAGRRVALSSGGRVVHVSAGPLDAERARRSREARPDVVLLVGRHRRRQQRGAARLRDRAGGGALVGSGGGRRQRRRPGRGGAACSTVRRDAVRPGRQRRAADRGAASGVGPARDPGDVPGATSSAASTSRRGRSSPAMVRGATPDLVLSAVELLARGVPDADLAGRRRRGRGRRRRGDHRRVLGHRAGRATTPTPQALSHEVVAVSPGEPHGRGGPRRAVERGVHGGGGS